MGASTPCIWRRMRPATAPTMPKTPALKGARIGGRVRQISATSVGAVTQTTVAGAQPKSTSAATVKANPSETRFASAPSTGTGKRSARVDATRNASTPTTVVVEPGSRTKKNVAAQNAATPTRETGATTASNLAGGSALPLISLLPGEVREIPGEVAEQRRNHDKQGHKHEGCVLRGPLKHSRRPLNPVPHYGESLVRGCAWASPERVKSDVLEGNPS